jgi:protein gp37
MNALHSAGRRPVHDLTPHPLNDEIYGDGADNDLIESIRSKGILNPLLVTNDNRIISGHRRWEAAIAVGLDAVPVVVFGSTDELDIEEALIEANRQRTKNNEQIGREYKHLKRIIAAKESRQGQRNDLTSDRNQSEVPPTRKAAEQIGVSQFTANRAERVVDAIDTLQHAGDTASAAHLRTKLESSVNGAYVEAKSAGLIPAAEPPKPKPQASIISVDQWNNVDAAQRAEWLFEQHANRASFNETNDNIEWAAWSWNPVTGCLHDCSYCYARDIANRFFAQKFAPSFLPSRLNMPSNTKTPDTAQITDPMLRMAKRNVFVCSMADLFGKWVPAEWIHAVLQQAWDNPQWNFLFLTKFPIRMAEFDFPPNSWIGTTVDRQWAVDRAEKAFRKIRAGGYQGIAWLSCEPMMERLQFSSLEMFDWVIMGGSSKSTQTPEFRPPFEWIVL